MFEKFPKLEKTVYTPQDLEMAKEILHEKENNLNSFDMSKPDVNGNEAIRAKNEWDETRKNYREIFYFLNPDQKTE